ncbi:hypothetical protein CF328_g9065, partial [Tilletia controversa]
MSDAQEAFRAIKAHPSQLPGLFIALPKGGFGIDTRLPFGLASATRVWGSVADLVKMLITSTMPALRVIKWVDDFVFIKPPDSTITLKDIHQATEVLGFPWHPVKQSDFDSKVTYLGFIWDLHAMTVKLPDSKREAFSLRASAFLSSSPRSLKEVRETCGALQHVASMARDLAPFLAEFFAFMKAWESKEPYHRLHVPAQVQDEAKVWVRALRHEMVRSIAMPSKEFPHVLYVDASTTWGVGVTCDDRWAAWMLLSGWDADGRGIGWAEAAALELGVRQAVAMGASDCVLRIFSDNKGVIGAFRKGRSRGRSANSIMRSLIAFAMQHHLDVRVTYVATDPPFDPSFMPHGDIKWYQKQLREEDKARYPRTRRQGAASLAGNKSGRHPTPTHRALRRGSSSSASSSSSSQAVLHRSSISKSLSPSALTSLALVGRPQPPKTIKTSKPSSIGKKPLARDRIMTIAPISGDNPGLKTSSGFDFDPQGCHWHAVHQILASSLEASTRANYGA